MRRLVIITALLCTTLVASADDYAWLTIEQTDGSKASLTAVGLTISFSGGNLVATNGSESATIALPDLSAMRFSTTNDSSASGISSLETTDGSFNINDADAIFDLNGRQVPPGSLKKGVYIIKKDNQTRKIQVK